MSNLKIKLSKSDFWKSKLEFLGHNISSHGISPMTQKVSAVQTIQPPENVKEVTAVIGLLGFVSSCIPAYSEHIRHMSKLTRKGVPFVWDEKCQKSLDLTKELILKEPILIYPDKNKVFHLYSDASNFTWSAVLMQTLDIDFSLKGREETNESTKQPPYVFFNSQQLHPIVYHSGSFQGSQRNWSAFQKEAAAIHRAVLRMAFYLTDSDVIVHSDHKPLAKFIEATTANTRVNDWSFQINAIYRTLQFKFIK